MVTSLTLSSTQFLREAEAVIASADTGCCSLRTLILRVMLLSRCEMGIDFCDLKSVAEGREHLLFALGVGHGRSAAASAVIEALDSVLERDKKSHAFIVHIDIHDDYPPDEIAMMMTLVYDRLEVETNCFLQVARSDQLQRDEVHLYLVTAI